MKQEPIKVSTPYYIDYLLLDSMFYQKLRMMGYQEDTMIMRDLKEQIRETIKAIGN